MEDIVSLTNLVVGFRVAYPGMGGTVRQIQAVVPQ